MPKTSKQAKVQNSLPINGDDKPNLSPVGMSVAKGLSRLVAGQQRFAEEFGLSASRVFPKSKALLQGKDLETLIGRWLCSDEGKPFIGQLFNDLVAHQLALVSALDGIALQTLSEVDSKKESDNLLSQCLKKMGMDNKKKDSKITDLQQNQQLRHQKIVAPGFVSVYSRSRETLQNTINVGATLAVARSNNQEDVANREK